jgi:hypothetical protein
VQAVECQHAGFKWLDFGIQLGAQGGGVVGHGSGLYSENEKEA